MNLRRADVSLEGFPVNLKTCATIKPLKLALD